MVLRWKKKKQVLTSAAKMLRSWIIPARVLPLEYSSPRLPDWSGEPVCTLLWFQTGNFPFQERPLIKKTEEMKKCPKHTFCSGEERQNVIWNWNNLSKWRRSLHRKAKFPLLSAIWQIDAGTFVTHWLGRFVPVWQHRVGRRTVGPTWLVKLR